MNYLGMDGGIRTYDVISGINGYGAKDYVFWCRLIRPLGSSTIFYTSYR